MDGNARALAACMDGGTEKSRPRSAGHVRRERQQPPMPLSPLDSYPAPKPRAARPLPPKAANKAPNRAANMIGLHSQQQRAHFTHLNNMHTRVSAPLKPELRAGPVNKTGPGFAGGGFGFVKKPQGRDTFL